MRRLILPFERRSRKSLVSDSAGCDDQGSSWLRKSLASGSAGLGGSRDSDGPGWLRKPLVSGTAGPGGSRVGSTWLRKSLVSGSVGRGGSELDRGRSSGDWCAVDGQLGGELSVDDLDELDGELSDVDGLDGK